MHGELAAGHVSREGTPKKRKGEIECLQRRRRVGGTMRGIRTLIRDG
jgi:hypothetical protein